VTYKGEYSCHNLVLGHLVAQKVHNGRLVYISTRVHDHMVANGP